MHSYLNGSRSPVDLAPLGEHCRKKLVVQHQSNNSLSGLIAVFFNVSKGMQTLGQSHGSAGQRKRSALKD